MQKNAPLICTEASITDLKEAFYNGRPIASIKYRATHYGPHNDELFGGYLLEKTIEGRHLFPGIELSAFGPVSATELREKKFWGKEGFFRALQCGILLIGIGGGPLDEHRDRGMHISCTALIVRLLDLMKEKRNCKIYGNLIQYVNFEDGNGDNALQCLNRLRTGKERLGKEEAEILLKLQIGGLAQNLKKGFEAVNGNDEAQKRIFSIAYYFYNHEVEQAKLFVEAEEAYDDTQKQLHDIIVARNLNPLILLEMKSDRIAMNKVVHYKWRDNNRPKKLGVLFLSKTNGQFTLIPSEQHISAEEMREVVKILRQMIAWKKRLERISFKELGADQTIDSIPEIHFDESRGIISNGSKVDPFVPGLIGNFLSVEDVIEAVKIGLNPNYFQPKFSKGCQSGTCVKGACWMYNYGLQRCHNVRDNEKKASSLVGAALISLNKKVS